jgi:hypothetical protein
MRLARWRQADDGSWWALCHVDLWSVMEESGRSRAEPFTVESWAPADHVEPVPGEDYTAVPRTRSRAPLAARRRGDPR